MPEYLVRVTTIGDSKLIDEVPAQNLQYSYVLNGPGAITFVMPNEDDKCSPDILSPGEVELYVIRDGVKVWGGYLWSVGASVNENTRFSGNGFSSRLGKREVRDDLSFPNSDQLDIVSGLLSYTQDQPFGDLGIAMADYEASGVTRAVFYKADERKYILDAINEISKAIDGFDYEIDENKQFAVYFPRKGQVTDYVFELGINVINSYVDFDAEATYSDVSMAGRSSGDTQPIGDAFDALARSRFGLLQNTYTAKSVTDPELLVALAEEQVRLRNNIRALPQVYLKGDHWPEFPKYKIGDTVRVKVNSGYIRIDRMMRVKSVVVNVANAGDETIGLYFDDGIED